MQGKSGSILHNSEKTEKLWLGDAGMHNACLSLGFFRGKGSSRSTGHTCFVFSQLYLYLSNFNQLCSFVCFVK